MSKRYKVLVVGTGKRGMHHAAAFKADPSFELAGLCDIDTARAQAAVAKLGVAVPVGTDAAGMADTSAGPGQCQALVETFAAAAPFHVV